MKTIHGDLTRAAGAVFSDDERYRYRLWRDFAPEPKSRCVFVMLNPSTADAFVLDPTVRRCIEFARSWGHDALDVVNLFALRSTDPKTLYAAADPVGPENDDAIVTAATRASRIVLAWGTHGALAGRGVQVVRLLRDVPVVDVPEVLSITKDGHPGHPLYLPKSAKPTRASVVLRGWL